MGSVCAAGGATAVTPPHGIAGAHVVACGVAPVVAWVAACSVVSPNEPLALGLACVVAVPLACVDAGTTPLTCRTCPGSFATLNEPVAADAPPTARTTPSTLAAAVTINLVDVFMMTSPFIPTHYRFAVITVSAPYEVTRRAR